MEKSPPAIARRWLVRGRVQGVGFRWFVVRCAREIGLNGWVRNEDDGRVHVFAVGPAEKLDRLAGHLHLGPPMSEVRAVEEIEAAPEAHRSFEIR